MHLSHVTSPSTQKNSTYQREFGEKQLKLFDSKELDCRQDKIRNLKISFIKSDGGYPSNGKSQDNKKFKANTKNAEFKESSRKRPPAI